MNAREKFDTEKLTTNSLKLFLGQENGALLSSQQGLLDQGSSISEMNKCTDYTAVSSLHYLITGSSKKQNGFPKRVGLCANKSTHTVMLYKRFTCKMQKKPKEANKQKKKTFVFILACMLVS